MFTYRVTIIAISLGLITFAVASAFWSFYERGKKVEKMLCDTDKVEMVRQSLEVQKTAEVKVVEAVQAAATANQKSEEARNEAEKISITLSARNDQLLAARVQRSANKADSSCGGVSKGKSVAEASDAKTETPGILSESDVRNIEQRFIEAEQLNSDYAGFYDYANSIEPKKEGAK